MKDHTLREQALTLGLSILAESTLSKDLVLQGGGALHFAYGSPRYSEDLDFVTLTGTPNLQLYYQQLNDLGKRFTINNTKPVFGGKGLRTKWSTLGITSPLCRIDIDSRYKGKHELQPTLGILVETAQDIYADKIFANLSRQEERRTKTPIPFKPSDLYDLHYITKRLQPGRIPLELIRQKARAYQQEEIIIQANIKELATRIRDQEKQPAYIKAIQASLALPEKD